MLGGRSALLGAAGGGNPYGNWTGNYSDVSLLLRNGTPKLIPLDESPSPKEVTTAGTADFSTSIKKYGTSSMWFDGVNSYLTVPDVIELEFGSSNLTLEMWVKTASSAQYATLISRMPSAFTQGAWVLQMNITSSTAGDLALYVADYSQSGPLLLTSGVNVRDNEWHHIAIVRNGSAWNLYVDGISRATQTWAGTITDITGSIYIGRDQYYVRYFSGYIDDLRITKGVARYTANFTAPTAELPANITDDTSYNSVSLLLRNGTPTTVLIPLDESPSPKELTALGNAQNTTAVVKYGTSSMVFDGSNSVISTPYNTAFNLAGLDYTIEMWLRQTASSVGPVGQVPLAYSDFSNNGLPQGWRLQADNGSVYLYFNSAARLQLSTGLTLNTWQHLAICRSGSTTRMFLDGVQDGSTTSATFTDPSSSATLRIGAFAFPGSYFPFNGYIDDLRITKGVARYTKNFLPPPAELPAI